MLSKRNKKNREDYEKQLRGYQDLEERQDDGKKTVVFKFINGGDHNARLTSSEINNLKNAMGIGAGVIQHSILVDDTIINLETVTKVEIY